MGLDMYLDAEEFISDDQVKKNEKINGWPLITKKWRINYWRKFAPLHHYIVNEFAEGEDCCQCIGLSSTDCLKIADTISNLTFPKNEDCGGFFFGTPELWNDYKTNRSANSKIFKDAAEWVDKSFWRSVTYQASW